jgi:hypothetical protein
MNTFALLFAVDSTKKGWRDPLEDMIWQSMMEKLFPFLGVLCLVTVGLTVGAWLVFRTWSARQIAESFAGQLEKLNHYKRPLPPKKPGE